jgi:hypothetical protein
MSDTPTPLGATTPYPADGGLKAQVRAFDATQSIDDAMAAERIRQQQDPAHDQPPFADPGRPVPPHGSGPVSIAKPRTPFLALLATDASGETKRVEVPVSDVKFTINPAAEAAVEVAPPVDPLNIALSVTPTGGALVDLPPPPPSMRTAILHPNEAVIPLSRPITVTGTMLVKWADPILYRMVVHGEKEWEARLMHGRKIAIRELMWFTHNVIAHPISEITHWLGYLIPPIRRLGLWLHDLTIPPHAPNSGRG